MIIFELLGKGLLVAFLLFWEIIKFCMTPILIFLGIGTFIGFIVFLNKKK